MDLREILSEESDDSLVKFIDSNGSRVSIDYTRLDFPSLLLYLCQRRGTRNYIGNMFQSCDQNGSGLISRYELQDWMMKTGKSLTEKQTDRLDVYLTVRVLLYIIRLLKSIDFNNDGKIEFREFLIIIIKRIITADSYKYPN